MKYHSEGYDDEEKQLFAESNDLNAEKVKRKKKFAQRGIRRLRSSTETNIGEK